MVKIIANIVFNRQINTKADAFIYNIYSALLSIIPIALSSFVFLMISGRLLGPEEYGKFVIIQSVMLLLSVPMLLGLNTAMVKYVSEFDDVERKKAVVSNTYLLIFIFSITTVVLLLLFKSYVAGLFSISTEFYDLALLYMIFYTLNTVIVSTLSGLLKIKQLTILQTLYEIILLSTFFIFVATDNITFYSMIYSIIISYVIIAAAFYVYSIRDYVRIRFDAGVTILLLKFGLFSLIGGVAGILYSNIDKIIINKYFTFTEVGIYGIYYLASINLSSLLFSVFNTVYFPSVSNFKDKSWIFKQLTRYMPFAFVVSIPFIFVVQVIVLKLLGSQYEFNIVLCLLFSIVSILQFANRCFIWAMATIGNTGILYTSGIEIFSSLINLALMLLLIPGIGIPGVLISLIISYTISTILVLALKSSALSKNRHTGDAIGN